MQAPMQDVIRHLRRIALRQVDAGLSDGELLARFIDHRDEAAVTALVRRHGHMVGACAGACSAISTMRKMHFRPPFWC